MERQLNLTPCRHVRIGSALERGISGMLGSSCWAYAHEQPVVRGPYTQVCVHHYSQTCVSDNPASARPQDCVLLSKRSNKVAAPEFKAGTDSRQGP